MSEVFGVREVPVPEAGDGMRLDRFLSARFGDWSRSALARGIRAGQVTLNGKALRASARVRVGQVLAVRIPGLAPTTPPPPLPPVLYEDDRVVALDKPAGMACHPGGGAFEWAVVGLARDRWPGADLVHRLDKETSGILLLTKDRAVRTPTKLHKRALNRRRKQRVILPPHRLQRSLEVAHYTIPTKL